MYRQRWIYVVCSMVMLMGVGISALFVVVKARAASPAFASFTLDNVAVTVQSSFIPGGKFGVSQPGSGSQIAMSSSHHPYQELSVTTVPYGTKAGTEALPPARAGIAANYRSQLDTDRSKQGARSLGVPPNITIFGQTIPGEAHAQILPLDSLAPRQAIIVEWVTEAGNRAWIVRAVQEQSSGKVDTSDFYAQLTGTDLSSSTLNHATTVNAAQNGHPGTKSASLPAASGNLPFPSWWNGICDTNNYVRVEGVNAYPLGASYRGVAACGPRPAYDGVGDVLVYFYPGAWGQYEWECVELSMRYLYLAYGQAPYPANGNAVVTNYPGTRLVKVSNGTVGSAPAAGDVFSYNTSGTAGHTAVVSASNVDGNGNGAVSVVEQNATTNGAETYTVSNWFVEVPWGTITGWLHDPQSSSMQSNNNNIAVGTNADGRLEVFARGSDGNIWHNPQHQPNGGWNGWSPIQTGVGFHGDPAVARNADGRLEVFARGTDENIWHNWQTQPGGSWSGWVSLEDHFGFQGTPTVGINADGRLEVFARGSDSNIWHDVQNQAKTGWSGWSPIQTGVGFHSDPAVGVNADGRLEVFARGSDENIWHSWQTQPGGSWSGWASVQNNFGFQGTPAVARNADGRLEIFARGSDGNIWHNPQNQAKTGWSGWSPIQTGVGFHSNPAVGKDANGNLEVFALGTDNNVWQSSQIQAGGNWGGWTALQNGLEFRAEPATSSEADGRLEVFAMGSDTNLWHNAQTQPNGGWSGWSALENGFGFQQ